MIEPNHPQTRARIIGEYGCLAMCYLYCIGLDPEKNSYFINIISDAMDYGANISGIESDCTVSNAEKFINWAAGRLVKVNKLPVISLDLITKPTPVEFSYIDGYGVTHSHFMVVENGLIVFDPLENSVNSRIGKPQTMRQIDYI